MAKTTPLRESPVAKRGRTQGDFSQRRYNAKAGSDGGNCKEFCFVLFVFLVFLVVLELSFDFREESGDTLPLLAI